jgi:coatomer subunit epsilon
MYWNYLYINICTYIMYKKSVALIIQTYLKLDRLDLAKRELASTKTWAEDAMLAQLIEAWVGLRTVNILKYIRVNYFKTY